ncbi:MAG: hypothetical protein ABIG64_07720 [Candidatus Omnitrophota bacterium]
MLYKFCPFCQEIKLTTSYTITDYKKEPTQFLNQYCDDCNYLLSNNLVTNDIYNKKTILKKLRVRVISRIKAAYDLSATECTQFLGVDYPGYMKYLELFFYDNMSWDNINDWEIDHIKPVKEFDLSKLYDRKNCFHFTNTKPLFKSDHVKKGNHGKLS